MRISRSSLRKRRAQPNRRRFFEKLETRLLLTSAWQAPHNQLDVSGDGVVSPLDALVGINRLNEIGAGVLPTPATPPPYYDTNGDGDHSPIDVLLIINALNDTNIPETQIQLDLARDTAPEQSTNDDFITSDPRVIGTVSAYLGIASLTAALDGGQAFGLPFELSGEFMLDPILQLDGNDDGQHQLQVIAVDGGGRSTVANLSFFLDTVAPTIDTFGIVPSQAQPDGSTELEFVAMAGITQPNVPVELSPGDFQTVSNAQGEFRFGDYPLAVGANDLTVRVIDLAGNQSDLEYSITRTSAIAFELQEEGRFLTEDSLLVELGQNTGTRQLRFTLDVDFDGSDTTSYLGDVLLVYLLDPQDLSQTLLDGGAIGKPLLEFREDDVNFPAGLVTFDGFTAEIEVSSLADETEGLLWFQLIGHDADTASRVTVGKIANELDSEGIASPIFPPSRRPQQPGPAFDDLASLQPSQNLRLLFEKRSFNSQTGRYGAEIRIQNEGGPAGRQVAVAFSDLDSGITLSNRSGTTAGSAPYLNLSAAMPPGGLSSGEISDAVEIEFDNSDLLTLSFVPKILAGISNRAPVFSAVEPITIQPGGFFQRPLSVSDPDGDPIVFSIDSDGPMPTGSLDAEGNLVITPRPEDVGDYRFRVLATDGTEVVSQVVLVHVVPPSNPLVTRIEGTIEDVDEDPLGGVPVELDDEQMVTDADGDFYIEFDEPLEDPTLMVHGDLLVGTLDFPFIAEGLELLLGHELFSGATNVIRRPIFLPAIDTANAVPIDPSVTTTVTTPKIPGAAVVVQAGSAKDRQQQLFRGALSITEVPVNRTPAVLPQGQTPNMVVTIQPAELPFTTPAPLALPNAAAYRSGSQPAELQFTTPAPLSLPNTAAYPSGTVLDLWSSNPKTGTFNIVGTGRVSTEGNLIETVSGGIRNSGWYFFTPPPTEPTDPNTNIRNEQSLCEACKARVTGNSEVELHSGALQASHELASYQSLGVARGFTLRYDSLRADPRPIIHFGYDNVPPDPTVRLAANLVIEQGDFSIDVPGRPSQDLGLSSAENYWSIPASGGDIDVALQAELRGQPSGRYEYSLTSGLLRENSGQFAGSQSTVQGSLLHVDTSDSPFGIGWGLAGLQELAINPDGSVLLIDGDGSELIFEAPLAPGQPYVSPAGDFSVLERLPDDSFRRTATDQTVYAFNSSNKLASITDRNGNQTVFTYTANRLTSITDPVGLVTTFSYTADRITGVTDPASRTTVLEYAAAGNLERIIDPDSEDRTFEYDDRHLLTAEITKRGFREETVYDFAGRVVGRTTADGAEIEIAPLQTQELLLPSATQNPFAAPETFLRSDPIAFHTDGNGNTFATELDQYGQRVFSFDGEGNQDRIQRNAQNLVTAITDARGATTQYQYDTVGNLTAVIQESLTVGNSFGTALPAGELTNGTRSFDGFVGDLAPIDVYQFELDAASRVRVHLGDLVEEASVTVVTDTDNDGVFDRGTESLESAVGSPLNDAFFTEVLPPGAYFVVIEPDTFPQGENTSYTLELGAEPVTLTTASDPGNTLADATDLGVLQSAQSLQDIVGDLDPVDTF
ncbi:MAG: dockerin type I domain-containing protein, partial [Pirellulaceae bacterium]